MKAFISGALMSARDLERSRQFYERLAGICEECGYQTHVPHKFTDPARNADLSSESVFSTDFSALSAADLMVVVLDEPSTGVGAEIAIATQQNKRILGLCENSTPVSRFIIGMLNRNLNAKVFRYADSENCVDWLRAQLKLLEKAS